MLRYLVSSSAIGYTNRVFAVAAVLKRRYFLSHPLAHTQRARPPSRLPPGPISSSFPPALVSRCVCFLPPVSPCPLLPAVASCPFLRGSAVRPNSLFPTAYLPSSQSCTVNRLRNEYLKDTMKGGPRVLVGKQTQHAWQLPGSIFSTCVGWSMRRQASWS